MDQDFPITRCPHCQTTFRVRPVQLQAAHGRVRCGSCLQIFSAPENELRAGRDLSRAFTGDDSGVDITATRQQAGDQHHQPGSEAATDSPGASPELADIDDGEPVFVSYGRAWHNDPVEPDPSDVGNAPLAAHADDEQTLQGTAPPEAPTDTADDPGGLHDSSPSFASSAFRNRFEQARAHLDTLTDTYDSSRRHRRLWRGLAVLAALSLVLQLGWWQRDTLSALPLLNTIYPPLCSIVSCGLEPEAPSAEALSTLSSSLRTTSADALRLDAVIVNRGDRPQPLPDVVLSLHSMQGNRVADGRFSPADYLDAAVSDQNHLQPGRPISISLLLDPPGVSVDNFEMQLTY